MHLPIKIIHFKPLKATIIFDAAPSAPETRIDRIVSNLHELEGNSYHIAQNLFKTDLRL